MATLSFDETYDETIDPSKFTPVPAGKYPAMIVESSSKPTQAGDMEQLTLVWQITDGQYEGRKVWDRINMRMDGIDMSSLPPNKQKAIEIGQKSLNTIFQALGTRASDSAELHNIPCYIDIKIKPAEGQYPANNEVRNYLNQEAYEASLQQKAAAPPANPVTAKKPTAAVTPAAGRTVTTVAKAPVAPAGAKKPWQK